MPKTVINLMHLEISSLVKEHQSCCKKYIKFIFVIILVPESTRRANPSAPAADRFFSRTSGCEPRPWWPGQSGAAYHTEQYGTKPCCRAAGKGFSLFVKCV